ncbi:MAG: acetate--CoA ligase family protein [Deltaproteobacteria bacterium]|nr:acetate--CoA ligase family protein [Deltaproteobacteria bacterium]
MLTAAMEKILTDARETGWVMEPEAKRFFSLGGLDTPRFFWAKKEEEALQVAMEIGYPVVAKVVSPRTPHKSEVKGVRLGVQDSQELTTAFQEFSRIEGFAGMLVEEMHSGVELIVGAKIDFQFGPVILLGMGGTSVEIYKDVAMRMAPLKAKDVVSMVQSLQGRPLLEGYRGQEPIGMDKLSQLLISFSQIVMEIQPVMETIDLNPVFCTFSRALVADARIFLKKKPCGGLPLSLRLPLVEFQK